MKIAVVGLGLIGGSLIKCIKKKTDYFTGGYDLSEDVIKSALSLGDIDENITSFGDYDIIFIALYPADTINFLKKNIKNFKKEAIVIDLCGVKRYICSEIKPLIKESDVVFIGGHPMAGRELSGFSAAVSSLFDGASMILTPPEDIKEDIQNKITNLFITLGFGRVITTTPEKHDKMIAYTSQLAHILSSAYIKSPAALEHIGFSAGSFKDLTRVARLNEVLWSELFLQNADFLTCEIDVLIKNLEDYKDAISRRDRPGLIEMLRKGSEIKNNLEK